MNSHVNTFEKINAIVSVLDEFLDNKFPFDNKDWLEEVSRGFARNGRIPLVCVGSFDVLAIKIIEPSRKEVSISSVYYNLKGLFAVNILCDHLLPFTFLSGLMPGSPHNHVALKLSELFSMLQDGDGRISAGYWVANDESYV